MPKKKTSAWPADQVIRKPVSELVPYARNARTHSDEQVAQIAASIREWGWTVPILIDEQGGIIAGHGRIMAAQKLGVDEVPCMVASGWSEAKQRAYVIADNKLALNADWDTDLLAAEIQDVYESDIDLALLGFDGTELDLLMFDGNFEPGTEDDQGKLDELSQQMVCCPSCGHSFNARDHGES